MTGDPTNGEPVWRPRLKDHSQSLGVVGAGLERWLRSRLDDPGLTIGNLTAPGGTGVANETVLFDVRRTNGATEGYVARLDTRDSLYLDSDLSVHYRMYETMMRFPSVPTPAVLGFEADPSAVGAPFFVMEKIDGLIPSDNPSWATSGFIVDATPAQRRALWESTVRLMAEVHRLDSEPFRFLRTGATDNGVGDCLNYWSRSLHWARPDEPVPLADECEQWLWANLPADTALSWGDSRLPNVIYRDFVPVGLLDWDLVSLAGPQADLAWWILMTPPESLTLDGIGSHDDMVDLWEDLTGRRASQLRWFLVFGAFRLAAVFARLFAMMAVGGHVPEEVARQQVQTGAPVQLMSGLLELIPPPGVTPTVPQVRVDR